MITVLKSLKLLKMSFNLLKVKEIQTKLKNKSNKEIVNLQFKQIKLKNI